MRKIQIVPASELEIIQTYLNNYLIELSQFDSTIQFETSGKPKYKWLKSYFSDKDRYAIYLMVDNKIAGVALIRGFGDKAFEIAEFYVCPSFRGGGNAMWFAKIIVDLFGGEFSFSTRIENKRAIKFWDKFVKNASDCSFKVKGNYKEWNVTF